jgi:hypothetical protein
VDHSEPAAAATARAGGFAEGIRRDLSSVFSIDFRSLALFRVSLALIVFAEVRDRAVCFNAQYSNRGVLPGRVVREVLDARPSLLLLSDSDAFAALIFVATAIASVLMLIGWRTRLATIATFLLLFSIQTRNPLLNHNGDVLMRLLLMWGMFLPLGSYLSLDARWGRSRRSSPRVFSVASAGLLLQGTFVYFVVAASKFQYDIWWRGDSLWAVLQKDSYVRPLGDWFLGYPEIVAWMTHSSMLMESLIPILLFLPWQRARVRTLGVLIATVFQLNIFAVASIGTFQPLTILALFPFLPAWFWDRFTPVPEAVAETPVMSVKVLMVEATSASEVPEPKVN